MDFSKVHVVLCICFAVINTVVHTLPSFLDNPCGRIAYVFPLTNTRPVHLTFAPAQSDSDSAPDYEAQWMVDQDGTFARLSDGKDGVHTFNLNRTSHLKMNYSEDVRGYGHFKVNYGTCESRPLKLAFTDLGECGMLQLRPDDVTSGQDVQLVYLPPLSILANNDPVNVSWVFSPSPCGPDCVASPCASDCKAVDITEKYVVARRPEVAEMSLTIPDISHAQNGDYYVQCSNTSRTNKVALDVIVLEPPSHPVISPLTTIDGISYIIGRNKQPLDIVCNTTGGTKPVKVRFLVGTDNIPALPHDDGYRPDNETKLTGSDHHMAEVTCEVSNPALKKPLLATAKIYMIETPVNPRLIVNDAIEFKPINISCSVKRARPAPNITFTIGSEVVMGGVRTMTLDEAGFYSGMAGIDRLERRWNAQNISCCVSHELYTHPVMCTKKTRVSYKFRRKVLGLKLPVIVQEVRPHYVINVTCVVENANPKCTPIWSGKGNLFLSKSPVYDVGTTDGGVTSSITATLNVSAEDNGDSVKCYTSCAHFPKSTIFYKIRVPEQPKVFVNVSESNSSVVEVEYGESLVWECFVRSEPRSEISWKFEKNDTGVNVTKCGGQSLCLGIPFAGSVHNGPYTCVAENKFGSIDRTVVLLVTGEPDFGNVELWPLTNLLQLILGIVGLLLFVFLVGGIVYVVARKTMRKQATSAASKDGPHTRSCFVSSSGPKKPQYDVTFKCNDDVPDTVDCKRTFPPQHDTNVHPTQESAATNLLSGSPVSLTQVCESRDSFDSSNESCDMQTWDRETDDYKIGQTGKLLTSESIGEQESMLHALEDIQNIAPLAVEESNDQLISGDVSFEDMTSFPRQIGMAGASKDSFQIQF